MPIGAFELAALDGEYIDGESHVQTDVELELGRLGDRLVLTQTATHAAAPDRAVRAELGTDDARRLRQALTEAIGEG